MKTSMSVIICLLLFHVKKILYFLRNLLLTFWIFCVFQMFYNLRCYVRVEKELLGTVFVFHLRGRILHNVMHMHNCLRRRFCVEFCACACNIICKIVLLVKLEKCTGVFPTRSIHADSKSSCKSTKRKQEACFKKI